MEGIATSVSLVDLASIGASGIATLYTLAVLFGLLVPKRSADRQYAVQETRITELTTRLTDARDEAATWRTAYEAEARARTTTERQNDRLALAGTSLGAHIVGSIPSQTDQAAANAAEDGVTP